jgi:hypothetical protein
LHRIHILENCDVLEELRVLCTKVGQ